MLSVRFLWAAALGAAMLPAAQAALTFDDARALYRERSALLRADAAEVERARAAADAAKSLSGPKVDIAGVYVKGRKDIEVDVPSGLRTAANGAAQHLQLPVSIPSSLGYNYDFSGPRAVLQGTWALYTGGRIAAKQNALEDEVRVAQAEQAGRFESKDAELAQRYWGVQLARSVADLRKSRLADEEAQVARAKRFEKKGLISGLERMSVEVSRDAARREAAAAETNAHVAEAELMHELRETTLPELATPLFVLTGDLGTLSAWQKKARVNSPLLRKTDAQIEAAAEGVRAAKGAFHPQVFAFGMKNLVKHYLTPVEPDWMAGIGVKFTLWDTQDRMSGVAAAKAQAAKAQAAREETDNQLMSAVETAFLRTTEARNEYELTVSTVNLAAENLRLREKSFGEGLSTALDVREARTQLTGAQIAQRAAAYKFVAAWAMLHASCGAMADFSASLGRADLMAVK